MEGQGEGWEVRVKGQGEQWEARVKGGRSG